MAAALIVIEIAAPKVSDEALAVLVAACNRAARDASCVLAKNASDEQPAAVAIVSLQAEDTLRVEVGVRQGGHDSWRAKDFAFLAADAALDRWRAVGFAIGTLAEHNALPPAEPTPDESGAAAQGSARGVPGGSNGPNRASGPSASNEPSAPSIASGPSAPSVPSAPTHSESVAPSIRRDEPSTIRTQAFIGATGIFGAGLDQGPPRLGSKLEVMLAPPQLPVFVCFGGSAATRVGGDPSGAGVRWLDGFAGLGLPLFGPVDRSGLELNAAVLGEYFYATASAAGRTETRSRGLVGAQGGFGGRLLLLPGLFLTAEVEAAALSGATLVRVGPAQAGTAATFRYLGSVGLRVRLR